VICVGLMGLAAPARADVDLALGALIGSGTSTGDGDHNLYALQYGGFVELIVGGYVMGFRALRARATGPYPTSPGSDVLINDHVRAWGGDLGYEWELLMLHLGPRLGIGRVTMDALDLDALYLDPGGVAEIELGPFLGGVDIRYRVAIGEPELSGLLAYARLGLRF
jgi:hypothetical protein